MNKSHLSQSELIEYYLGKDRFKDKYFKPEFPSAYEISPSRFDKDDFKSKIFYLNPREPNMEFKINNLGYRSDIDYSIERFQDKNLVLCFGCTDTFGMQLDISATWPSLLGKKIHGYEVLNLGIIGATRDTIARTFTKISQVLSKEIKYVCILWPHPGRREFVSKEFTQTIYAGDWYTIPYEEYWNFIDWKSNNYNHFKNYHLIKNICKANSIELLDIELERFDKKVGYDFLGPFFALGKSTHIALSDYFSKKINQVPSLFEVMNYGNNCKI